MDIRIRDNEEERAQPYLLWDTVWDTAQHTGNWQMMGDGNLKSDAGIETAVIIQLFTDKRLPDYMDLEEGSDRRGWFGDKVDIQTESGEEEMGSLLWTLERQVLTDEIARRAKFYAEEALQVLINQGAVERQEIVVEYDRQKGMMWLDVKLFSHDGNVAYERKFQYLWELK